jgi:hypothetical protein
VNSAVDHDVGRLQIAVQHAPLVCRGDARAELSRDVDRLVLRDAPDAPEQRREILAVDVLHREEAAAVGVAEVVQAADVLARDLPGDAKLVVKLPEPRIARSMPAARNFSATGRSSVRSSARSTSPMPPRPSSATRR